MKIPVFYSLKTGRLLQWTIPANDKEEALINYTPGPGRGVIVVDETQERTYDALQARITFETGLRPEFKRFAIIDADGNVKGAIVETIDKVIPGCRLVEHPDAAEGWKQRPDGSFVDLNPPVPPKVVLSGS